MMAQAWVRPEDPTDALRGAGGCSPDPVRLHFLAALTRRIPSASGLLRQLLEHKLDAARAAGPLAPAPVPPASPPRHADVSSPLARLNDHIRQATQGGEASTQSSPEIKSVRRFVDSWSRLAAQDEIARALERGPENAGPLNSHLLVLRSLSLMGDLSPDYLRRFLVHVDALLWLEQAVPESTAGKGRPTHRPQSRRQQTPTMRPQK